MPVLDNMEGIFNFIDKFSALMDENTKGVSYGCYSVALIGLTIAVRRVKPFTRFRKPSDIPNQFIKERRELIGTVKRIEPSNALLMVRHKPLLPFICSQPGTLPVKVSGISVTGHGVSWLQIIVVGQEIKFIPILKEKDYVHCEVLFSQQTREKKLRTINVAETLLLIGFGILGNIEKSLFTSVEHVKYYNRLKVAEANALRKKLGLKYYIKPTLNFLSNTGKTMKKSMIQRTLKPHKKALQATPTS